MKPYRMWSITPPRILARLAPVLFGAGLVLGSSAAAPTASALSGAPPPSVTLQLTASANSVQSGNPLTYTIALSNPEVPYKSCDYTDTRPPRYVCNWDTMPGAISGITVSDTLPAGLTNVSVNGSSGFACTPSGSVVTCSGGLVAYGSAAITISATTPANLNSVITLTDSVNVSAEGENASVQTTVTPPPLPDLVVNAFTATQTVQRGGLATFTISVANIGPALAGNVYAQIVGQAPGTNFSVNLKDDSGTPGFGTPLAPFASAGCGNSLEQMANLNVYCPGLGWGPPLAPGGTLTATFDVTVPSNATVGAWYFNACVNPAHPVVESNYNNNCAPTRWMVVY